MVILEGNIIQPEEIIASLKKDIQLKNLCYSVLYHKIITEAAQNRGITISKYEIQSEIERLKRDNNLVENTHYLTWLTEQLIAPEDWEESICNRLQAKKLAECLFAKEVEKYFSENQQDFEQVLLYRIVVPYTQLAREISYQIQEDEMSFYEAAHLYDIDTKRRYSCGYEGKFYRGDLDQDFAQILFKSRPGEIIGPLKIEQTSHLLLAEEIIPAELTPEIYQEILNHFFKQWLDAQLKLLRN
ncbi:peptidylprolyl isomerase [Brunnivagina elsteri]|uniref:peptidylprolyl isomerase n=1 Tax=Brunnivagina elsteri CCALA 953 TaxID=987040 RepID=A0A2A2TJT6_9CYAN|nr:peptidylprolyl isomerase [Calothrix elsteri]PAX55872.1 peptidylprolyl isomerase [Calothrix elsteri CCALA 953]